MEEVWKCHGTGPQKKAKLLQVCFKKEKLICSLLMLGSLYLVCVPRFIGSEWPQTRLQGLLTASHSILLLEQLFLNTGRTVAQMF